MKIGATQPSLKRSPSAERREMEGAILQKERGRLAQRGIVAPSGGSTLSQGHSLGSGAAGSPAAGG